MSIRPLFILAAVLLAAPVTLAAQRVSADIAIGGGPVSGRILIGDPYPYYHGDVAVRHYPRYRPAYREVVILRGHRGHGWYRRHGYHPVRAWYDAPRRFYYHDRPIHGRPGLREIVLWEREGRYIHELDGSSWRDEYRDWRDRDRHWRDDRRRDDRDRDDARWDHGRD